MTFNQIVKHFKGVTNAARQLGFTRTAIYHWRDNGIPLRTQQLIEGNTCGALKASAHAK